MKNKTMLVAVAVTGLVLGMVVIVMGMGQSGMVRWNGWTYQLVAFALILVYPATSLLLPGRKRRKSRR